MTATQSSSATRSIRLGADAARSASRIRSWSLALSVVAFIGAIPTLLLIGWLASRAESVTGTLLAVTASVIVIISVVAVVRVVQMGMAFRAVKTPPSLPSLVTPLESLNVVMEWLAVLAFVGLVVLVGTLWINAEAPEAIAMIGKSKEELTVERMREVAAALDDYARAHQRFPDAESYQQLRVVLGRSEGRDALAESDGWGRSFVYTTNEYRRMGGDYTLVSLGGDGMKLDPSYVHSRRGGKRTPAELEGRDIQIESGVFVLGPDNVLGIATRPEAE